MEEQIQTNEIKEIYHLLGDDLSQYIFENRLMYSLTEDMRYLRNIVCTIEKGKEIYSCMKSSHKTKIIFGAGSVGKRLIRIYDDIKFECFVDNYCEGQIYKGIPVIGMKELKNKYSDSIIIIISTNKYHKEILQQLLEEGFHEDAIINIGKEYEKLNHLQYFDLPQLEEKRMSKEIFIDGGSYDGNTSVDFKNWCGSGGYVYAWEPDSNNRKNCEQLLKKYNINYQLIPKGLWSKTEELKFKMNGGSSAISEKGDITIAVESIDNYIKEPITFIKMDIEGAEYQALLGAKNMISQYKPKLAICIYHKLEDIWKLPWLIHQLNSKYRFYLRHYSFGDVETVLYAL